MRDFCVWPDHMAAIVIHAVDLMDAEQIAVDKISSRIFGDSSATGYCKSFDAEELKGMDVYWYAGTFTCPNNYQVIRVIFQITENRTGDQS